uniref:Endoplasmic reticulum membrane protein 65 n=1 Tax=Fusarium oxysporum (strain Fo5176) TaxID=660025 RepID=A0A0D2XIR8_FUSOF
MAASVDSINSHHLPPLLSPSSTPPPSCADTTNDKIPTITSDEDHSSEEGSHRSSSVRRVESNSSISEPAVEDDEDQEQEPAEETLDKDKDQDDSTAVPSGRASRSSTISNTTNPNVRRLSATEMQRLTNSPESLPVAPAPERRSIDQESASHLLDQREAIRQPTMRLDDATPPAQQNGVAVEARTGLTSALRTARDIQMDIHRRPSPGARTLSTPPTSRVLGSDSSGTSSPRRYSSFNSTGRPTSLHLNLDGAGGTSPVLSARSTPATAIPLQTDSSGLRPPSPIPPIIPLPPMSLPTHLQLELAAQRPSPLYIHQSHAYDIPYESNAVKFERLKNVILLPPHLEMTLNFGALACLDAWLWNFTILPMRFIQAVSMLVRWWGYVILKEVRWLLGFVWYGLGRLWRRGRTSRADETSDEGRSRSESRPRGRSNDENGSHDLKANGNGNGNGHFKPLQSRSQPKSGAFRHRRTKSMPSNLSAFHKADLLQGAVIICSSMALMTLDASRMYHFIRAQSAIKLYVIYNILEVGDRLLSALGQDILECLFSTETLSRNASGRSKVLLPLGMFMLALVYCCLHSIALYYQVITLNVAVNSYSNALLTLLLSNQFVEIKSTVFKRFEKDNLFQLTCADIVERFQLWIMLFIIGMRNVVEVGGLSVPGAGSESYDETSAFMTPSLTKRLGLAVIPLSCLFIRASIQTYHMLLSTHLPMPMPMPIPQSTQTSLSEESATPSSPAMIAALNRFDSLIRDSLGRATYGYPYGSPLNSRPWYSWTSDDFIAAVTMVVVFFIAFLVLLILKLLLGMVLLKYSRNRYAKMKRAEHQGRAPESFDTPGGRRVGGFGQVEVGEERQRWIHADRNEGLKGGKGPGKRVEKTEKKKDDFEKVMRYEMVAKRIW